MKVVVIEGSPRKGSNSAKLAAAAVAALAARKPEVERFRLNDLQARGCQACFACKKGSEVCVVKDDLKKVLEAAAASDMVIMATPIYIGEITAQLKILIDRTYSWYKPEFVQRPAPSRLAPGKSLLLVVTQGNPDPGSYRRNLDFYEGYLGSHGFKVKTLLAAGVGDEDVVETRPELLERVAELVEAL